jgi:hypothetical protein
MKAFSSNQYTDGKSQLQNQAETPLIVEDDSKMSEKQRKLRSMSNYLKNQIAKKLDQLQREKERMNQEGMKIVEKAQQQEREEQE